MQHYRNLFHNNKLNIHQLFINIEECITDNRVTIGNMKIYTTFERHLLKALKLAYDMKLKLYFYTYSNLHKSNFDTFYYRLPYVSNRQVLSKDETFEHIYQTLLTNDSLILDTKKYNTDIPTIKPNNGISSHSDIYTSNIKNGDGFLYDIVSHLYRNK